MAIGVTPLLKTSNVVEMKNNTATDESSPRFTFNIPAVQESIIEYINRHGPDSRKKQALVKKILSPETEISVLFSWISEFKDNILFLDRQNETIVDALLKLEWWSKDSPFIRVYQELILNLVTALPFYLEQVLDMIIGRFSQVSSDKELASDEDKNNVQHVHYLLRCITQLIPLSKVAICEKLAKKFPYIKLSANKQLFYVENLLAVISYLPFHRSTILECIIVKMINLDVLCPGSIIQLYEEHKENYMDQGVKETDMKVSDDMAYPLAHTLDLVLNCLFSFVRGACFTTGGVLNWEATKKLFKELLTIFDKTILKTQECCHVQFLMFYICSFDQRLCDGFLDYLWKKVRNGHSPPVLQHASAFYIGSYLSAARYISINTVKPCLDLMCNWIHSYINTHKSINTQELDVHGTFHSVCQAMFFVISSRCKELLGMKDGHKYLQGLKLVTIATCHLNPLRYCDPTIVHTFATIAKNNQIAYVYPIIEKNKRLLYSMQSCNNKFYAGAMLTPFFPFNPYALKKSKHWLESLERMGDTDDVMAEPMEEDETISDECIFSTSPSVKNILLYPT